MHGAGRPRENERPPEAVYQLEDEPSGLSAWIVVDDTRLGPAFGGVRVRSYPTAGALQDDARGLARHMTWKCAAAGLPAGGGKAVVDAGRLRDRARAFAVLGDFIESLGGRFRTAGDLGTGPRDLEVLAARTRFVAVEEETGDLADAVALGLEAALEAVAPRLGRRSASDLSVAIQGQGAIGGALARRLAARGARLIVADLARERAADAAQRFGAQTAPAEEILGVAADVFAPCAAGGVLDAENAASLGARAVVGGANRILASPAAGRALWRRGVLYVPDFVANSGAVIRGVRHALAGLAGRDDEILAIGPRVLELLAAADRDGVPPEEVAMRRVEERLQRA